MTPARRTGPAEVPGLAARRVATDILDNVLRRRRPLDSEFEGADQHPGLAALADRDRALVRKLAATVLRRIGTLRHMLNLYLDSGFPPDAPRVETVLLIGAAQILFLDVPDHAAVDLSVRLVQADRRAAKNPGLINAVLRRVTREGPGLRKTAQLGQAGAHVTAVVRPANRLARLRENLARLGLTAEAMVADATEWQGGPFDAVLIDAPCSSTGTIRRHPDVGWLKNELDIAQLIALQRRLLDRAVALTKPGGRIVYCTCSLEPEEGEQQIEALLAREPALRRIVVNAGEIDGIVDFVTPAGDLRTLPSHWPDPDPRISGLDGFFAARLERI